MLAKKFSITVVVLILFYAIYTAFSAEASLQKINVQLMWYENKIDCQSTFSPENNNGAWFIEQFQFFLSEIEVASADSGWQRLKLQKNLYQNANTVLLGQNCEERKQQVNSEPLGSWSISFENHIDISKVTALRFTLGLPFELNHLNPVSQESPLNLPEMFWVWQTGHKFMRAELSSLTERWLFHLGSTGCKAPSVMRSPISPCRYPNVFDFEIPIKMNGGNKIDLNLNLPQLLANVELAQGSSCQSQRNTDSCMQLFKNLSVGGKNDVLEVTQRIFEAVNSHNVAKGIAVE
jgi:uncharacterized repeat protein (TIGR04052 family)